MCGNNVQESLPPSICNCQASSRGEGEKSNIQHFKTEALELKWSDSCSIQIETPYLQVKKKVKK